MSEVMGTGAHIRWSARRALKLYDQGNFEEAVIQFLDDIGRHAALKSCSRDDPEVKRSLREAANSGNRDKFEQTMLSCCDEQPANA